MIQITSDIKNHLPDFKRIIEDGKIKFGCFEHQEEVDFFPVDLSVLYQYMDDHFENSECLTMSSIGLDDEYIIDYHFSNERIALETLIECYNEINKEEVSQLKKVA